VNTRAIEVKAVPRAAITLPPGGFPAPLYDSFVKNVKFLADIHRPACLIRRSSTSWSAFKVSMNSGISDSTSSTPHMTAKLRIRRAVEGNTVYFIQAPFVDSGQNAASRVDRQPCPW